MGIPFLQAKGLKAIAGAATRRAIDTAGARVVLIGHS